jgi:FAD/FMN-containing dehydrogenase
MEFVAADWETQFLESIDASRGFGFGHYAVDNLWTDSPEAVMPVLAERLGQSPSPLAHAVVQFKIRTALPADAALSRIAPAYAGVYSVWRDPQLAAAAKTWLRETMAPLAAHARGHYINEIDAESRPERIAASFSAEAWRRLDTLRARADPRGVFHDFFGRPPANTGREA